MRRRDPRQLALLGAIVEDGVAQIGAQWRANALTLLGIVWGASAVILLLGLGADFDGYLDAGFKKTGDRWMVVVGEYTSKELGGARPGRRIELERADYERVRAGAPSALYVAAEYQQGNVVARSAKLTRSSVVSAATPDLRQMKNHQIALGRFFDDDDEAQGRHVVVLGADLVQEFYGDTDPLGRDLKLDGIPFRVTGVLQKKGSQFVTNNAPHDEMLFIPMRAGQRVFDLGDGVGTLLVQPHRLADMSRLTAEVHAAIRPYHDLDPSDEQALRTFSIPEMTSTFRNIGVGLKILLGFIGSVVLAVSGVGVSNLMATAVHQRSRELAMRRACGARRRDLYAQLLVETVLVVLTGGLLGVGLGVGLTLAIAALPLPDAVPRPALEPIVIITTFSVLVTIGLVSGLAPARQAADVDPATVLRST